MTLTTYKWTLDRYHQAIKAGIFDDQPVELLKGDLVVMPPEGESHAYHRQDCPSSLSGCSDRSSKTDQSLTPSIRQYPRAVSSR
jgi:hypothetical protein